MATYSYDQTGPSVPGGGGVVPQLIGDGTNTYNYDAAGNRTGPGYVVGAGNELLSDGTYDYTYDADGNETSKTSIATGVKWTYGYNALDQMVSAVETTANGTVETEVEYRYDALGNRVEQGVNTGGATTVCAALRLRRLESGQIVHTGGQREQRRLGGPQRLEFFEISVCPRRWH